jgi:hypothetical protein
MECSTTELRQHATNAGIGPEAPCKVRRSLPQGHWPRKRGAACGVIKTAQNQLSAAVPPSAASIAGRFGSHFGAERLEHLIGRIMTSNSVISPDSLNLMRSTCPLNLPSVYSPPVRLWKRRQFGRVYDEG